MDLTLMELSRLRTVLKDSSNQEMVLIEDFPFQTSIHVKSYYQFSQL
jgi:hypothetical protein